MLINSVSECSYSGFIMVERTQIKVTLKKYINQDDGQILDNLNGKKANAGYGMLASSLIFNWLLSGVISMLWGLLNDLSSLTMLSLIAIEVSGVAQIILGYILTFTQLDVLPSNMIYNSFLIFNDEEDEALSDYFDHGGFSSRNALNNMGSTAIFLALNLLLFIIIILSKFLHINRLYAYLSKKYMWSHFIRTVIQQYLTISAATLIQMPNVSFEYSGEAVANVVAGVGIIMIVFTPLFLAAIIYQRHTGVVSEAEFDIHYQTLTEGLRGVSLHARLFNVYQLLKWEAALCILIFLRDYPSLQLVLLHVLQILYQFYLIAHKPFSFAKENKLSQINELLVSGVLYFYMIASDFNEDLELRDISGYGILLMLFICLSLGFTNFSIAISFQCKLKAVRCRRRVQRAIQRRQEMKKVKREPQEQLQITQMQPLKPQPTYKEESIFEESFYEDTKTPTTFQKSQTFVIERDTIASPSPPRQLHQSKQSLNKIIQIPKINSKMGGGISEAYDGRNILKITVNNGARRRDRLQTQIDNGYPNYKYSLD